MMTPQETNEEAQRKSAELTAYLRIFDVYPNVDYTRLSMRLEELTLEIERIQRQIDSFS